MLSLKKAATEDGVVPELIRRFREAVGGRGSVGGPYAASGFGKSEVLMFYARGEAAREIIELLWPWLGAVKRERWIEVASPRPADRSARNR